MCNAQKLKHVIEDDYELFCKNEYSVLKIDKSVKHGHFKSTWVNGNPRIEGHYEFGLKDSLWTYFDPYKPIVSSRGYYQEGNKIGIWEYFDQKGKLLNRYDHSINYLSFTTFKDTVATRLIQTADTILEVKMERAPIFLEGETIKFRILQENTSYPQTAVDANIFGTVIISFYINVQGEAVEYEILKGIGGGCDEEALRVVKLIPNEWAPGIFEGQLIKSQIIMPITFTLN